MARTSSQDPVDKFRFQVVDLSPAPAFTATAVGAGIADLGIKSFEGKLQQSNGIRSGFTDITLPKSNTTEINYRENLDSMTFRKIPGLTRYDPVTLKRGVTHAQDLYDWYSLVNTDAGALSDANKLSAFGVLSHQENKFRKDLLISTISRTGDLVKHWILYEAWPSSFKGGDDLDASAETKLVEELTLCYELCLVATGSTVDEALNNLNIQIVKAGQKALTAAILSNVSGALQGVF